MPRCRRHPHHSLNPMEMRVCANNRNEHKKHEAAQGWRKGERENGRERERWRRKSEKRVTHDTIEFWLVLCTEQRTLFKLLTVNHERRDLNLNWRCKTKGYVAVASAAHSKEIKSGFNGKGYLRRFSFYFRSLLAMSPMISFSTIHSRKSAHIRREIIRRLP